VKVTTEIQYGLRSLCDMVYNAPEGPVQARCIAERQNISSRYIEQIFQKLRKGGIIRSVRGPSGGYCLVRNPEEISVGDVIRAVDGADIALVLCEGKKKRSKEVCDRFGRCVVSDVWGEASKKLMDYFDSVTLDAICDEARQRGLGI
jgi:Rrf2 family transcriptional regulator, iron-sulfur cluster assembly transcription factor